MKIATWNVNGIRARGGQVEQWLDAERPDVHVPAGDQGVTRSGADDLRRVTTTGPAGMARAGTPAWRCSCIATSPAPSAAPSHPAFDFEYRIASVTRGDLEVAVRLRAQRRQGPRGQDALPRGARQPRGRGTARRAGRVLLCGDLNVALTDLDLHPKERKPDAIGQRPEERALLAARDRPRPHRRAAGTASRRTRGCSPGGRRGATCASATSAGGSTTSWRRRRSARRATRAACQREFGTSDHAPLVVEFA